VARWGTAAAFAGHGLEALWHSPVFADLILNSASRRGLEMTESTAMSALTWIGAIDLLIAMLLVSRRWRWVALYATFWGLVTAGSRITANGFETGWFETMIRASHFGLPAALAVYWWRRPDTNPDPDSETQTK
jgi:hypothetical protein